MKLLNQNTGFEMKDTFLMAISGLFAFISIISPNDIAVIVSVTASVTVIIKNRKTTMAYIRELLQKLKR